MVQKLAAIVAILYGAVSVTGGLLGAHLITLPFLAEHAGEPSMISLYAGGAAGLLLLLCAVGSFLGKRWPLAATMLVALVLIGKFVMDIVQHRFALDAFFSNLRGQVSLIMTFGGALVFMLSGVALISPRRKPKVGKVEGP
jgi:hypothetical protein